MGERVSSVRALVVEKDCELSGNAGAGIEDYVADGSGSGGDKALVPFIETCDERRPKHGDRSPPKIPAGVGS